MNKFIVFFQLMDSTRRNVAKVYLKISKNGLKNSKGQYIQIKYEIQVINFDLQLLKHYFRKKSIVLVIKNKNGIIIRLVFK